MPGIVDARRDLVDEEAFVLALADDEELDAERTDMAERLEDSPGDPARLRRGRRGDPRRHRRGAQDAVAVNVLRRVVDGDASVQAAHRDDRYLAPESR